MRVKPFSIIFYFVLFITGILMLFINSKIQQTAIPQPGEYYYSNFLRNNYSYISGSLLFLTGLISGYYFKSNPWVTGISLIAIFPITAIYEATIYRGSHNLIPLELAVHFLFALPAVIGAYLGRYFKKIGPSK
jgi:hypothetical protein